MHVEESAAAGITAVPRSLALSVSPTMAGAMLGMPFSGLPFVICGSADCPTGWSPLFAEKARDAVLPGYTVFSIHDAQVAAKRLLRHGQVRLKRPLACGSRGQIPISKADELDAFLKKLSRDEMTT